LLRVTINISVNWISQLRREAMTILGKSIRTTAWKNNVVREKQIMQKYAKMKVKKTMVYTTAAMPKQSTRLGKCLLDRFEVFTRRKFPNKTCSRLRELENENGFHMMRWLMIWREVWKNGRRKITGLFLIITKKVNENILRLKEIEGFFTTAAMPNEVIAVKMAVQMLTRFHSTGTSVTLTSL